MKTACPRCGQSATVTYSARGTERIHTHKRADGMRCAPAEPVDLTALGVQGPPPSKVVPPTRRVYAAPLDDAMLERVRARVVAQRGG